MEDNRLLKVGIFLVVAYEVDKVDNEADNQTRTLEEAEDIPQEEVFHMVVSHEEDIRMEEAVHGDEDIHQEVHLEQHHEEVVGHDLEDHDPEGREEVVGHAKEDREEEDHVQVDRGEVVGRVQVDHVVAVGHAQEDHDEVVVGHVQVDRNMGTEDIRMGDIQVVDRQDSHIRVEVEEVDNSKDVKGDRTIQVDDLLGLRHDKYPKEEEHVAS